MAAPTHRGSVAAVSGATTTSPSGTQVGDLVLVYTFERLGAGSASTLTKHSSMDAELVNLFHNDGSTDGAFGVAAKIATQAGAQSYQGFTSSTGTPTWFTGCVVLQAGTFAFNPANLTPIPRPTFSQSTNALPNPASVTLSASRDYQVIAIAAWHLGSAATVTPTAPTNYTNLVHVSGSQTVELASATRAITGGPTSEDPGTFGDDVAPNGTCGCTIGIPNQLAVVQGIGQPSDSEVAQALGERKAKAIGQPSEAETAHAFTEQKAKAIGQTSDAEVVTALGEQKAKSIGLATETEIAHSITVGSGQTIAIGQATETGIAHALGEAKTKAIGLAADAESATAIGRSKAKVLGQAVDVNIAQALTLAPPPQIIQIGQAVESSSATVLTVVITPPISGVYDAGGPDASEADESYLAARAAAAAARYAKAQESRGPAQHALPTSPAPIVDTRELPAPKPQTPAAPGAGLIKQEDEREVARRRVHRIAAVVAATHWMDH